MIKKNYQFNIVFLYYVLTTIIVTIMGVVLLYLTNGYEKIILITTMSVLVLLSIICIILAIIIMKKIIEPMSRMLKSGSGYNLNVIEEKHEDEDNEDYILKLRDDLRKAKEEKKKNDTILTQMKDGIISFDINGKITYINPAAKLLLELDENDIAFNNIFSNYEDINMEKIIYLEHWTSSSERIIQNNQGVMNLIFVPFKDEINRPTGLMAVVQDITETVKLNEMRKEFVADVSHELKTPLTSIKGFSETLLNTDCDKETTNRFLKIIDDNVERMEKLVKDLLILSQVDKRRNLDLLEEFDLGKLAKQCTEKFEIEIKNKNQTIQCLQTAKVPLVYANKDEIERVILNIISNSVKYTDEGGKIDVFVGFLHNDAYIKIKDNGMGIPKKDLEKVFDRFYRVNKDRARKSGGTGLGLSIAKEIIEKNKGSISISSTIGKGTEVLLKIPVKNKE